MPVDVLGSVETRLDHAHSLVDSPSPKSTQTNRSALPQRSLSDMDRKFLPLGLALGPPRPHSGL